MKRNASYYMLCLMLGVLVMSFNSCEKNAEFNEELLIGKWKISGEEYYYCFKNKGKIEDEEKQKMSESEYDKENGKTYIIFNKDHTYSSLIDDDDDDDDDNGDWLLSGNKLLLNSEIDDDYREGVVKELTSSKLVIYYEVNENEDDWTYIMKITTTLRKIY